MANPNLLYQIANPNLPDLNAQYAAGQNQANALAEIARAGQARALYGQAIGGDKNALAELGGLDPQLHNVAITGQREQKKLEKAEWDEFRGKAFAGLSATQTPEQWATAIDQLDAQGRQVLGRDTPVFEPWERDFANRDRALAQFDDLKDVLGSQRKIGEAKAGKELELEFAPQIAGATKEAELPVALALEREKRKNAVAQQSKPPAGYRWKADGNLEAIPGGAADIKLQKGYKADEVKLAAAKSKAETVIGKVDEALANVGFTTTGLTGSVMGLIPGRAAYDLENTIDTIRAVMSFKELADMRAASPTGGALGQVTVRELELLSAAIASLDKGQSEDQLVKNLGAVKTHYQNWLAGMEEAYRTGQAPKEQPAPQQEVDDNVEDEQPNFEEVKEISGKRYGRIGEDWFEAP